MTTTAKEELEALTASDGPLVQLVGQVRASNVLARKAMRLLYSISAALFVLTCILIFIVISLADTSRDMAAIEASAEDVLAKVALLNDRATAQVTAMVAVRAQLDDAPKIVADEATGRLKIVAVVDAPDPPKTDSEPIFKKKSGAGSKKSSLEDVLDEALGGAGFEEDLKAADDVGVLGEKIDTQRTVVEFELDPTSAVVQQQEKP